MKRVFLVSVFFLSILSSQAQIKVSTSNNVGIGADNPESKLSVNTNGNSRYPSYFYAINKDRSGFFELENPSSTSSYNYAITAYIRNHSTGNKNIVANFYAYQSASTHNCYTMGARGVAGNGRNGFNYGLFGCLYGNRNGAGIVGSLTAEPEIDGKYAGYFNGNVRITDTLFVNNKLFVNGVQITSDIRLKEDINTLRSSTGEQKNLDNLLDLNPISYKLIKQEEILPQEVQDSISKISTVPVIEEDLRKTQFGLSAQELETIYPELVAEDKNGYKSINYTGLIPILIEGMREQQAMIEELKVEIALLKAESKE